MKPSLFISRCIEFASCRWDGETIHNEVVRALKDHVEFLPICPEMEIGLRVPRDPLQMIVSRKKKSLIQIKNKRDLTSLMKGFATKFLENREDLDGFILKSKSPSCGAYSTKFYKSVESPDPFTIGSGLFAEMVQKVFPLLPIIEDSDLVNEDLLDYFLTRVYTLAAFRVVAKDRSLESLRQFQNINYLLFQWFNPEIFAAMNTLLKQEAASDMGYLLSNYQESLLHLLHQRPPLDDAVRNLTGAIYECIQSISGIEWQEGQEILKKYHHGEVSFRELRYSLKFWALNTSCEKILKQTFWELYPPFFSQGKLKY